MEEAERIGNEGAEEVLWEFGKVDDVEAVVDDFARSNLACFSTEPSGVMNSLGNDTVTTDVAWGLNSLKVIDFENSREVPT